MARRPPIIVIPWKENIKHQKRGEYAKSLMFYENSLNQEQRPFEENKTIK